MTYALERRFWRFDIFYNAIVLQLSNLQHVHLPFSEAANSLLWLFSSSTRAKFYRISPHAPLMYFDLPWSWSSMGLWAVQLDLQLSMLCFTEMCPFKCPIQSVHLYNVGKANVDIFSSTWKHLTLLFWIFCGMKSFSQLFSFSLSSSTHSRKTF